MKNLFVMITVISASLATGQTIIDLENFELGKDTFENGSDLSGGFHSGSIFLPNIFNTDFNAWAGWAISSMTDTMTPGFDNQYSCIAGTGADSSATYAVGYFFDPVVIQIRDTQPNEIKGIMINNATYPYFSMRDGDGFAKKFGGASGSDPDYFLLTIKSFKDGQLSSESVDFYLADFRSENNSEDYIIKDWTYVDLSNFGIIDSLQFSLSSSDVGIFGMNTPSYFCIDNISLSPAESTALISTRQNQPRISIYPNPVQDQLNITQEEVRNLDVRLFDLNGKLLIKSSMMQNHLGINVTNLPRGMHTLVVKAENGSSETKNILKQ